jgi:hypothetical protein
MMLRPRFFHHEAIDVLHYNKLEPHNVLLLLSGPLHLSDRNGVKWTFIARRQTRAYLLAKYAHMDQFKEVYSMGHSGTPIPMLDHRPYFKVGLMPVSTPPVMARPGGLSYHDLSLGPVTSGASTSGATTSCASTSGASTSTEGIKAAEDLKAIEDVLAAEDLKAIEDVLAAEDLKAIEDVMATEGLKTEEPLRL